MKLNHQFYQTYLIKSKVVQEKYLEGCTCLLEYHCTRFTSIQLVFPVPDPNDYIHLFKKEVWYQQLPEDSEDKKDADDASRTICEFLAHRLEIERLFRLLSGKRKRLRRKHKDR